MYDVTYMTQKSGRQPVKEFIDSLDAPLKARVLRTLSLLEEFGPKLMMPYSKHIDDGIFELWVMTRGIAIRIFYFSEKDKVIVLTHGFVKKSQRLPRSELNRAKRLREEWEAR